VNQPVYAHFLAKNALKYAQICKNMHKHAIICSIIFIIKDKFHRINLFIQNLLIYSERQKYGVNSLKIKQTLFQKKYIKIHILKLHKIPSIFPIYFFLNSDSPFNSLNDSIKVLLSSIRKFLRKKFFLKKLFFLFDTVRI
jgi:hypothetical protein